MRKHSFRRKEEKMKISTKTIVTVGMFTAVLAVLSILQIPMRDIADDYYDFDEKNFCLIGRRHHNKYQLGDAIRIKVAQANLEKKQLDFALAGDSAPVRKEKPAANTSSSKAKKSKQKTRNHHKNK